MSESRKDRLRKHRQKPEVGPEEAREILEEQGLGAHELPVAANPADDSNPEPEDLSDPFLAYKTPPLAKNWTAAQLAPPGEPEAGEMRLEAVTAYPGLFRLGLDGQPFVSDLLPFAASEKQAVLAWAAGVWLKQAAGEAQRQKRALSEVEAKQGRKIPEASLEARQARAEAYAEQQPPRRFRAP